MPTVRCNGIVNGLVHKGGGWLSAATIPDVCKTPPASMAPLPYPNISYASDLVDGSVTVFADGNSIGIRESRFSTSVGDEPGAGGGVVSNVHK